MVQRARKGLLASWAVAIWPWLWLAVRDLSYELTSPGKTSDAPHQFGTLALIDLLVPLTGACLLLSLVLSVHVWLREPGMRGRIVVWFGILALGAGLLSLLSGPAAMPSRAVFNGLEAAWLGSLSALPVFWVVRAREGVWP